MLADAFLSQKDIIAGYLARYAGQARTSTELACGTGEFTRLTAENTGVTEMVALDISEHALAKAAGRVSHDNVRFIQGDFWADHGLPQTDLVVCVDAIHHLGDIRDVLRRLRSFVKPGGIFIGNVFTADNFHEFERLRYGALEHTWRTALFFGTALMVRLSGGRLYTGSHRTQLRPSEHTMSILTDLFDEVLDVTVEPYFTAFAARA